MRSKLGDRIRLKHILDAIEEIEAYTVNMEMSDFFNNSMVRFACIKQLEIIGEASNHISEDLKSKYSHVSWEEIISLRNVLVHEYFGVDATLIWQIIEADVPQLKAEMEIILNSLD
jgi:uncharacterized protein with HEPN domain